MSDTISESRRFAETRLPTEKDFARLPSLPELDDIGLAVGGYRLGLTLHDPIEETDVEFKRQVPPHEMAGEIQKLVPLLFFLDLRQETLETLSQKPPAVVRREIDLARETAKKIHDYETENGIDPKDFPRLKDADTSDIVIIRDDPTLEQVEKHLESKKRVVILGKEPEGLVATEEPEEFDYELFELSTRAEQSFFLKEYHVNHALRTLVEPSLASELLDVYEKVYTALVLEKNTNKPDEFERTFSELLSTRIIDDGQKREYEDRSMLAVVCEYLEQRYLHLLLNSNTAHGKANTDNYLGRAQQIAHLEQTVRGEAVGTAISAKEMLIQLGASSIAKAVGPDFVEEHETEIWKLVDPIRVPAIPALESILELLTLYESVKPDRRLSVPKELAQDLAADLFVIALLQVVTNPKPDEGTKYDPNNFEHLIERFLLREGERPGNLMDQIDRNYRLIAQGKDIEFLEPDDITSTAHLLFGKHAERLLETVKQLDERFYEAYEAGF